MRKRYDIATILKRATEVGIEVTIEGERLKIQARHGTMTEQARVVLQEYEQEILHYLQNQEILPLCSICLMMNIKTVAFFDHEGRLYCENHYPTGKRDRLVEVLAHPVVSEIMRTFNVNKVEILDASDTSHTFERSREQSA